MRVSVLMTVALSLAVPALAQNSDAQGVVNEPAVQKAIRGALDGVLKVPGLPAENRGASLQPAGGVVAPPRQARLGPQTRLLLPPRVCAVPLLPVPANPETDAAILLKNGPLFDDSRIILAPPAAACPAAR